MKTTKGCLFLLGVMATSWASAESSLWSKSMLDVGLEYGAAEQAFSNSELDNQLDENDTGYRLYATYYGTPTVGVRVGFADFGETTLIKESFYNDYLNLTVNELSAKSAATAMTVGGVFVIPVPQGPFSLLAEFGFIHWNLDLRTTRIVTPDGGTTESQHILYSSQDLGFYGGGAVTWNLDPRITLGLSVLWYMMEPDINGDDFDLTVNTLNVMGTYRF